MLFTKTPKRDYFNPTHSHKPLFRERQHSPKSRNHTLLILVSFLCFLLGVVISPLSRAESGELLMQSEDGESTPALLHSTHVELQVNGMTSIDELTTFQDQLSDETNPLWNGIDES